MKTTEVNKELIGRRCECISFGTMVTGAIEDITVTKYTAEVKVRYDEPQRWGNEILHSGWAHGDKDDESGSLKYLHLLPEPVRPDYETLIVTFAEPIRTLELPASVTAIEFGAFMGCDNLRYVLATGNKITTLGDNLFGEGVPSKLVYKK